MSFYLAEVSALRDLDHVKITKNLENRRQWRMFSLQRYGRKISDISEECEKNIHKICNLLLSTDYEHKHVVSTNVMWVYTNEVKLLGILDKIDFLEYKKFTQVKIDRPKNSVFLKKSNHTHRSYFKTIKLSVEEKQQLSNFFLSQEKHIRLSPSLKQWLNGKFNRTQDYFFIDHSGEQWLLMLALVMPSIVRKTFEIITHK
jgi:hypothetical protein